MSRRHVPNVGPGGWLLLVVVIAFALLAIGLAVYAHVVSR